MCPCDFRQLRIRLQWLQSSFRSFSIYKLQHFGLKIFANSRMTIPKRKFYRFIGRRMNSKIVDRLVDGFIEDGRKLFIYPFHFVGELAGDLTVASGFRDVIPQRKSKKQRSNYGGIYHTIYKSRNYPQYFIDRVSIYCRCCGPRDATRDKSNQYTCNDYRSNKCYR